MRRPHRHYDSGSPPTCKALGDRRILLVIDDAWREEDLRPFLQGGRNTTRLITTRRDDILPQKAEREHVDAMGAGEALALLSWGLPDNQAQNRKTFACNAGAAAGRVAPAPETRQRLPAGPCHYKSRAAASGDCWRQ